MNASGTASIGYSGMEILPHPLTVPPKQLFKKSIEEKLFPQIYFNTNFLIPTTLKIIAII